MKKLAVLLLVGLMATSAFAGLDDGANSIGLYFDSGALTNEMNIGASTPFFAYIILSNPTFPELSGFELSYDVETPAGMEAMYFRLGEDLQGGLNVAQGNTATSGQYVVGWGSPRSTSATTILASWQCMLLSPMTVNYYFGPSNPQSIQDGWPALEIGGSIIAGYLSSGSPDAPVAIVNGTGVVSEEVESFGGVKALFR